MTGQSAGALPTRHDGDRIPRAPRTKAGQSLAARAKRESWGNWEGIAQFVIPAIEDEASAAPSEPPLDMERDQFIRAAGERIHAASDLGAGFLATALRVELLTVWDAGRRSAAPSEPPRLLDFVSAYFDTVDGDGRPAAVYRAEQDMRKEWERIVSAPVAAAPPEPPLDCGRLARAIDEHIESDCPRDTACDGTCADSIAERYGGAAPDRLPSVEEAARLLRHCLSVEGIVDNRARRDTVAWLASLHEEPEGTTRPVDPE